MLCLNLMNLIVKNMDTLKFENFTEKQRNVIAEFVYSYETDILIKSDAISLLEIMLEKDMIDESDFLTYKEATENNTLPVDDIIDILFICVEEEDGKKIMQEYFGN